MTRRTLLVAVLLLVAGRTPAAERDALETAIDRGLEFIKNGQREDGSWSQNTANTGLALMAFLSAGHVPGEGPYGQVVERGVRWLLAQQAPNGLISMHPGKEMYHHGLCTLLLAELVGMAEGPLAEEVRKKLELAVRAILLSQRTAADGDARGGWRYRLDARLETAYPKSDLSVVGWQVMALRAAKNVGCDVPAEAIADAVAYVRRCYSPLDGGFRYYPGGRVTAGCTGAGVVSLVLAGREHHQSAEVQRAGAYLLARLDGLSREHYFAYASYYGAQATFQLGGNYWAAYRRKLHELLLRSQTSTGSWPPADGQGSYYSTSMVILALTVEYRFLPIYQRGDDSSETGK